VVPAPQAVVTYAKSTPLARRSGGSCGSRRARGDECVQWRPLVDSDGLRDSDANVIDNVELTQPVVDAGR